MASVLYPEFTLLRSPLPVRYGVAFIVAYIGVQLILSTFRYVPEWSTCAVSGFATWRLYLILTSTVRILVSLGRSASGFANENACERRGAPANSHSRFGLWLIAGGILVFCLAFQI